MRVLGGCASDIGSTRKINQDGILFRCLKQHKQYFAIGAVCDGIGGLENGELSSAMIIAEINSWMQSVSQWIDISVIDPKTLYSHLKDQAEIWNEKLFLYKTANNLRTGTTMSVIMIIQNFYYIIHVGDSRIYLCRNSIEQMTADDSQTRFENGRVKKYLSNYMGKNEKLTFQCLEGNVMQGDIFLFCTDGMYHHMREEDIEELRKKMAGNKAISKSCQEMIANMIERGEKDNISLGVIYIDPQNKKR